MDPIKIIQKYYDINSLAYQILIGHSQAVAHKSIEIAKRIQHQNLNLSRSIDLQFIEEAAMLHDIGIIKVAAKGIGCFGEEPYLLHGILGREMLENEGLPKQAMVCERHIGIGLSAKMISDQNLPLPVREMVPLTLEEEIICYADCFFSKHPDRLTEEKTVSEIRSKLVKRNNPRLAIFDDWVLRFK